VRIAFIDYVLDPDKPGSSGLSDVVWDTARELAKLGDEVHVVGPYTVEPEPVPGVTVHRFSLPPIGYRNIVGHVLIVLNSWREVRKIAGVEVIYAPEYLSSGLIAPFSRVPVVLRTPGNIYERLATANPYDWYMTQVFKLAARASARWCALVIAISHDMGRWWLRTGVPSERLTVIANGVDVHLFHRRIEAVPVQDRPFTVLVVGRLSAEKNVEVVIDAVARLIEDGKPVVLQIVGDGPLRPTLERRVRDLGLH
jgi:glycosyltransferase involved in cell wall biosynthesis